MIADDYGYTDVQETMTRKQVIRALTEHGIAITDFDAEHAIQQSYSSDTVLAWLGY